MVILSKTNLVDEESGQVALDLIQNDVGADVIQIGDIFDFDKIEVLSSKIQEDYDQIQQV